MLSSQSTPSHSGFQASDLGLIFTDARGRVVFVDNRAMSLLGQVEAGRLVGEPLHSIMRVAFDVINALLADIARTGYVHERPLVITRSDGSRFETMFTGIASYDDQHTFIGADLTLRDPAALASTPLTTHGDVLGVRIQQIEAEADAQIAEEVLLAQLYVTALISAVQVLLARMGGKRVSEALEGVLNGRAVQAGWPFKMAGGQFIIDATNLPSEAYRALIDELIGYARNVTGSRLLFQEMRALEEQMTTAARDMASQFGMRDWTA
jgi:hypothetical protein